MKTATTNKSFFWKRKKSLSEKASRSIAHTIRNTAIGLALIIALSLTALLTFHQEFTYMAQRFLAGQSTSIQNRISSSEIKKIVFPTNSPTPGPSEFENESGVTTPGAASSQSQNKIESPWGVAEQISEYTWQIKVGPDERMGTPQEIFLALNEYRKTHQRNQLTWDSKLAEYAQSRADFFEEQGQMDEHAGFKDFLDNQDGFNKVGFYSLGENSAYLSGGPLTGTHIIEWLFASDPYHDANQLETKWTHVGIGIKGPAVNVIFGGRKQ